MVQFTLRLPEHLHRELRRRSYVENRSQQKILMEIVEQALAPDTAPASACEAADTSTARMTEVPPCA